MFKQKRLFLERIATQITYINGLLNKAVQEWNEEDFKRLKKRQQRLLSLFDHAKNTEYQVGIFKISK